MTAAVEKVFRSRLLPMEINHPYHFRQHQSQRHGKGDGEHQGFGAAPLVPILPGVGTAIVRANYKSVP